jgi:hypothetical protein
MTDYSEPNQHRRQCSNGWYALPRNNHACRKCGARLGETCKAEMSNPKQYENDLAYNPPRPPLHD